MEATIKPKTAYVAIALIALLMSLAHAQPNPCPIAWRPTLRISNTASSAFSPKLAVAGDTVHVVYHAGAVYYRRSTNGGQTWGVQLQLVPAESMSASLYNRPLVVSRRAVSLVWANRNSSGAITSIKVRRSTDGGESWLEPQMVAQSAGLLYYDMPIMATHESKLIVLMVGGGLRNYMVRSFDGGQTWDSSRAITGVSQVMGTGDIFATSRGIHFVGGQSVQPSGEEIAYMMSSNNGEIWSPQQVLSTIDVHQAWAPNITADDVGNVYVLWQDAKYGTIGGFAGALLLRRSYDNGMTWLGEQVIGSLPSAERSAVSTTGEFVHVAWSDNRFGSLSPRVYHSGSTNRGASWCGEIMLGDSALVCLNPTVATNSRNVYAAWSMRIPSIAQIHFRRGDVVTGVANDHRRLSKTFAVSLFYPNPFNASTRVQYNVPIQGKIFIAVYDAIGRRVETLLDEVRSAGLYQISLGGSDLASGIYFVRFQFNAQTITKPIVLVR